MAAWSPGVVLTLAGWVLTWPLLWLLARALKAPGGFPFRAGVSAMAWWLATVLFALSVADVRHAWGGSPFDRLPLWRQPWVPPAVIVAGVALGWLAWK